MRGFLFLLCGLYIPSFASPLKQIAYCTGEFENSLFEFSIVQSEEHLKVRLREHWDENKSAVDWIDVEHMANDSEELFIQFTPSKFEKVEYLKLSIEARRGILYMTKSPSGLSGFSFDVQCQ